MIALPAITEETVLQELRKIKDPEYKTPLVEMGYIDKVTITGDNVKVEFHLNSPYASGMYAMMVGRDMRRLVAKIQGVKDVTVLISDHVKAEMINREVNQEPLT